MPRFGYDGLLAFAEVLLASSGLSPERSRLVASLLLKADLEGYPGHGISRIPAYLSAMEGGLVSPSKDPEVVHQGQTTASIDGNHCVGQVAAHQGMNLAISKAAEHGVGIVCIFHSSHIGRLGDYVEQAAENGMIGFAAVSVGVGNTSPYGGMEPVTGTNPIAFGIPGRKGNNIIVDFATAAMSMGELRKKASAGDKIPDDVLLDGAGNPTNDFSAFLGPPRGAILPFGGHKGYGLNLVTEVLGGLLAGNGLGREWWGRGTKGGTPINGVFLQAIRVEEFQTLDAFYDEVDELVAFIKSKKPAQGFKEVLLPGEGSRKRAGVARTRGIELPAETWAELTNVAAKIGPVAIPEPLG